MDIVPDEWLLDCLRPDDECYSISKRFLDLVERKQDRIAIRDKSPFTKKLSRYSEVYPTEFKKLFWMLLDSEKVLKLAEGDILSLPEEIAALVPDDDKYLVELFFSTNDKVFVTTDSPLAERIRGKNKFKVFLFEEFIELYDK